MLKRQHGFTLMEVMITVAIVAILAAIAFPSYQDSMRKSRRTDGKNALTQAVANMERFYAQNNTYATATLCAAAGTPSMCPGVCSGVGGTCTSTEGNYGITIPTLTANTFLILATPTGAQPAADGKMTIDQTGAKQHDANNDTDYADAGEDNWK